MNLNLGVLVNLRYQLGFYFSVKGKKILLYNLGFGDFCCVLFLINAEYDIGLNVDFQNRYTSQ